MSFNCKTPCASDSNRYRDVPLFQRARASEHAEMNERSEMRSCNFGLMAKQIKWIQKRMFGMQTACDVNSLRSRRDDECAAMLYRMHVNNIFSFVDAHTMNVKSVRLAKTKRNHISLWRNPFVRIVEKCFSTAPISSTVRRRRYFRQNLWQFHLN